VKVVSFRRGGHTHLGAVLSGDRLLAFKLAAVGLEPACMAALDTALTFLEGGEELWKLAREMVSCADTGSCPAEAVCPIAEAELLPPVPQARKLLALAGNYREHIREGGRPTFPKEETYPYFFMKPPSTSMVGCGAPVVLPPIARKPDYEGELVIVVGKRARAIPPEGAEEYVAGYTILNDISERALASKEEPKADREQNRFFDWLVGKWYDTGAPCGPWVVSRDEVGDPHSLRLVTRVNGEVRQDGTTADMIFTVPEILAFISRFVTLEPGDLIATGTPAGVGHARSTYLQPGDHVEVEIERIGVLRNTVTAAVS
jgi:2-keto-4-pentenoate hydratase/2-oxohepta-3-ene-1,7-dioic acid hydratase in catechol pathway